MVNKFKVGQSVKVAYSDKGLKEGETLKVVKVTKCDSYEGNMAPPYNYECCKECGGNKVYLDKQPQSCWGNTSLGYPLIRMDDTLKSLIDN